jgi:hypothetical protein
MSPAFPIRSKAGLGTLVLVGLLTLAAPASALSPKTGSYAGPTSQTGQQMDFSVVKLGAGRTATRDVTNLEINSTLVSCSGPQGTQTITSPLNKGGDFKISKAGKFKFHGPITINQGTTPVAQGTGTILGDFKSAHKVAGSFQFSWDFNSSAPSGLQGAHCDTGNLTYTATKQ